MIAFSVRRPVTIAMAYLAVALLGVAAWRALPVELLPNADLPQLSINAQWPGASPETTEAFLTSPVEAAVQQVRGVEKVVSESSQRDGTGNAVIQVEFARDTDMDFARLDLSERLAALETELPVGVRGPYVQQYVPEEFQSQQTPFLTYTVTGPYTLEALRKYIDDEVAPELLVLDGVANVEAHGGRQRLLELQLDEVRINSLGLRVEDVYRLVSELEYVSQAGTIADGEMLRPLAIRESVRDVAQVLNAALLTDNGRVVRVRDVGTVHDTHEEARSYYRIDSQPAVAFEVIREAGTNTVEIADRVKARVAELEQRLPRGMRFILDSDESKAIRAQLTDLRSRALAAAAVVFIVLLLFLRSFRSAVITFATIVFSVLITINLIYFGGFTLNVLTLMGLAMGFGLIVDNAIVVLENIYRRARRGESSEAAAEEGAREVVLPIFAATFTNIVVLLPFVYLQGELRVFYVPLALVVVFSQVASLVVGFTFVPALAARLLRKRVVAPPTHSYDAAYRSIVRRTLQHPWKLVFTTLVIFAASFFVFERYVGRGVVWRPWFGQETYISISIEQPRGEKLDNTDRIVRHFESRLRDYPGVERYVSQVYPQRGMIRVTFPDSVEHTDLPVSLKEELTGESVLFGGAEVRVYGYGSSFYGGGSAPPNYSIKVLGYNYDQVRRIAEDIGARLQRFSRVKEVDTNSSGRSFGRDRATELVLDLDRRNLALHGLTADDVARYVGTSVRGESRRSAIRMGGEELQYAVKLEGYREIDVVQLMELQVPAGAGRSVRLGDVASLSERNVLNRILREDQQYQRVVSYEFRGPSKLGDPVKDAVIKNTALPPGFSVVEEDGALWSVDEKKQIYGVLAFAVVLIFMVCAALFESLRQPICILLTVPMALIGVFLVFWITKASFTREAYVGVIMMSGIVVNSAILLVDHVNQLRRYHGLSLEDALVRGSAERLRPIVMTTVTTVAGLLPLVMFSKGADANIWNALGYALIGGLTTSTVLVLFVTPALYLLFERGKDPQVPVEGTVAAAELPTTQIYAD
jgi:hydrophobic/amphiphilic exporter-1 (mainly G- bacteria), HAE1 family